MLKKGIFEKKFKFDHSLVFFWASLVFTSLLNVSKMGLANLLTIIFTKNEVI